MEDDGFFEDIEIIPTKRAYYGKPAGPARRVSRRTVTIEKPDFTPSQETADILRMLEETRQNVFLTGRAGTGKSTLLNYFRATTKKNIAVIAPTGVAAVNVHGETIHHFFKFGIGMTIDQVKKTGPERQKIFKALDMIVIDEVSMVRADLFDCIDRFMRLNGNHPTEPFGGVQMLVIGDLYQLPPVVSHEERGFFEGYYYQSPYFFDAKAYAGGGFETVELTHVYRQSDQDFIAVLDAIRVAKATEQQLELINMRIGAAEETGIDFQVSLVPRNAMADSINARHLERLPGDAKVFRGMTSGEFRDKDFPTAALLTLKVGAQVMLLNNEQRGRWVNGDLAKVIGIGNDSVRVAFEDGSFDDVARYTWEKVHFAFNEDSGKVEPTAAGSFTQFPMKLAWAVTIHKGQGKTYDRVSIDFGAGMFAPGQAYVALSRCRSLEGLSLSSPLRQKHIFTDPRIDEFMEGRDEEYRVEYI